MEMHESTETDRPPPKQPRCLFRQAQAFAERFAAHEGVVGVLLAGGIARRCADHFSEIDEAQKRKMLRVLWQQGAMPAAEFDRRVGLRWAIQSPLFYLLR